MVKTILEGDYSIMETNISTFYNIRTLLLIIGVSFIFYFSIQFFSPALYSESGIIPVWPAAGIAFSTLLLFGYRVWPVVLLGAFAANFFFLISGYNGTLSSAIWTSGFISIAHTSEALLGLFLLKKVPLEIYRLEKVKHVFQFAAIILIMCLWGAIVSVGTLCITQIIPWERGLVTWLGWWLGDSIGILTITPMILGWAAYTEKLGDWNKQVLIAVLLGLFTFFISGIVFFNWIPGLPFIKPYFIIPLFLWVAFYFELRVVTMVLTVAAFVAIYGTIDGNSFFISDDMAETYISLQLYIAIITGSTLILKAALEERKQSAIALQEAHDMLLAKVNQRSEELNNYQDRINAIFKTLVKYTVMDFSEKIHITEERDEIDAIATGLNTLGEELKAATISQLNYANELEQTNLLLIDSEQQIQTIFNNAPDSVLVIDMDNIILRWNPQAEITFGWKKDEVVGKPLYQFIVPKRNKAAYIKEMQQFFLGKGQILFNKTVEMEAVDKNGVEFPVSLSISPVMMEGKYMFIGFLRNVTEQKKAEKKIKQLAAIVESSDDAIISQSLDGTILSWNNAAEVIYGYSAEEAIGKPISITSPAENDSVLALIPHRLQQGEQVINMEIPKVKKNNQRIYVSLTASPIKDNGGNIIAISLISRDITRNKQIINEMGRITEELQRSNAELEQFAYVASHDLQEPLRMVTSYLQLLEKRYADQLDKDAFEFISYAVDGSKRMRNLIHSLLEYSRINRIKPFEWIDLKELMSDVLINLNTSIEENNAVIKVNELPDIYGDYVLVNQLFQNLISNALKFRSDETPEIIISGQKLKDEFLFSIKDNGIGFQKQYSEKVFVIFQRLHSKEKYPGTGMGLAICKKIVERHGGKIWVESDPGKGSIFYFTIKMK